MTEILAIGRFSAHDEAKLGEDLGAPVMKNLDAATALDESERARVRAIAFKGHHGFDGAVMDRFPALGLIANFGVGYDAINTADARARGVAVTNTPDVLNDDVADLAVGMLIAHCRRMVDADAYVRSGEWGERGEFPLNRKMSGGTAGILGLGRIGREIANRLAAFRMDLHYWSRTEKETPGWTRHDDPVSLARAVDYLFVTVVGGSATEGLVSNGILDALGPDGILVNVSRGSTVDESALLKRLEDGRLGGAALDVFRNEPRIDPRFLTLPNVLLQPHQGSGTHTTRAAMGQLQRDNIAAFMQGQPLLTRVV